VIAQYRLTDSNIYDSAEVLASREFDDLAEASLAFAKWADWARRHGGNIKLWKGAECLMQVRASASNE
jgi:hypothetical protein